MSPPEVAIVREKITQYATMAVTGLIRQDDIPAAKEVLRPNKFGETDPASAGACGIASCPCVGAGNCEMTL